MWPEANTNIRRELSTHKATKCKWCEPLCFAAAANSAAPTRPLPVSDSTAFWKQLFYASLM